MNDDNRFYSHIQPLINEWDHPFPPPKRIILEEAPHKRNWWRSFTLALHTMSVVAVLVVLCFFGYGALAQFLAVPFGITLALHTFLSKRLDK